MWARDPRSGMRLSTFDDWARAHHGIITFEASGLSRSAWYRAIDAGSLVPIHPLVARIPGTATTPEQCIAAAVLAVGGGAVASHRSAVRLWGAARPDDDPVDVLTCDPRRGVELDGVVLHRTIDLDHLVPQRRFGIPCTNILRTLVELGAVDAPGVVEAVGHAIAAKLADLRALEVACGALAAWAGRVVALRQAIDTFSIDAKPADSILEAAMARLVTRYHLPPVQFHPVIEGWEVDFHVVDTPVIIECDGWAYHGVNRANFERDRIRDTELIGKGWIVLRFTYRAIVTAPGQTARRIREAVDRWRDAPSPGAA